MVITMMRPKRQEGRKMVNEGELANEQESAFEMMSALGHVGVRLKSHELRKFGLAFNRRFVLHGWNREFVDLYQRHRGEIIIGAMIAKAQMEGEIDGEQPAPGKIGGPLPIRACWFGLGDDWEDIYGIHNTSQSSWSTGSAQNWIHSGTQLLAGTAGNSVKILENAVHVIIGIGTLHSSPKIESFQITIDNKTKPIYITKDLKYGNSGQRMRIQELDSALILKKNTTFLAKLFISQAIGAQSAYQQDFPFLYGASFISEDVLRKHDPANIPGTTVGVITTT